MIIILKYYALQLKNYWRQLRIRIQIEIIILFTIFYAFFSDKLVTYFISILDQPNTTPFGLAALILHIILIAAIIPTPFIFFNLFPKQKGLINLQLQPLSRTNTLTLLIVHLFKYELIIFLIVTPVFTALVLSTGIISLLYILSLFISILFFSLLTLFFLINTFKKKLLSILYYYLIFFLYFLLFYVIYWWSENFLYYNLLVLLFGWIYLYKYWQSQWIFADKILLRFRTTILRSGQYFKKLTYNNFPAIIPKSIRPFFIKDVLGYLRNRNYMRLKLITLLLYVLILIVIDVYFNQHYNALISIMTILLVWEHYSHQFNEKYVMNEPRSLIKVLPVRYYQFSIAKFLSEFLFIVLILGIVSLSMVFHRLPLHQLVEIVTLILLFSIFVLYMITIIRVIFYDNPRFAGYAYHFMIIFTLVMTYNFYLVGPIITISIIVYLQFFSYRQFVR